MCQIDQKFPDFSLEVYYPQKDEIGKISLDNFKGKTLVLFFYPADFTFVCPTELADMHKRYPEFRRSGAEIISVSTDTVYTHKGWADTEELLKGISFPMAADHNGKLSKILGIYNEETGMAHRAAFVIDADGILRGVDMTSDNIGRSAGEILRKVRALAFVRKNKGKACPASWDVGAEVLEPSIKIAGKVGKQIKSGK